MEPAWFFCKTEITLKVAEVQKQRELRLIEIEQGLRAVTGRRNGEDGCWLQNSRQ